MNRRDFLSRALLGSAAAALPGLALGDEATYRAFRAGVLQYPRLAALAGVESDMLSAEASIEGRWPMELAGVFYRNGPGRFERGGERYEHWFDGDGMVHAWHVGHGRVRHMGRFVRTRKYTEEAAAGQLLYPAFGTYIGRRPVGNNDTVNTANTNAVPHAGKLYALWEGGSATELDPQTLATRGIKTWRDDLAALPFSAHPKIEPDGTLWNFGALPGGGKLVLWRIAPDGSLGKVALLKVPNLAMVHDFVVTERHLVFLVPPFKVQSQADTSFLAMHHWQPDLPMRAVVVNKADFSLRKVLELPAQMVFHFGNAFDDGDTIKLDASFYDDPTILNAMSGAMHGEPMIHKTSSRASLVTLNLKTGTSHSDTLLKGTEFPRVANQVVGRRHDEIFMLHGDQSHTLGLTGVARVSLAHGKVDGFDFGANWVVEEHVPVNKANGKGLWLVGPSYDVQRKQTVLNVFDAAHLAAGPVARARLPYAAPLGFHGNFLAA